jgi:hypothetical protein
MFKFIQEVSFNSEVIEGQKQPEYKPNHFVNLALVSRVLPTKIDSVLSAHVDGKVVYIFVYDFENARNSK